MRDCESTAAKTKIAQFCVLDRYLRMIEGESVLAFFINFKFCLSSFRAVKPLARLEGAKRLEKLAVGPGWRGNFTLSFNG